MKKIKKKTPRQLSRLFAVQIIYASLTNDNLLEETKHYVSMNDELYKKANVELIQFLVENTLKYFADALARYTPYLTRKIEEINLVERVILAMSTIELLYNLSVPSVVIINEAVELTKVYGAEDSYKFINSLVDKLANEIRGNEIPV